MKQLIVPLLVLILLNNCKSDCKLPDFINEESKIREFIIDEFNESDKVFISPYDSCLLVNFISHEFESSNFAVPKVFNSKGLITNYTDGYSHYSFSIIKYCDKSQMYYGLGDVFLLRSHYFKEKSQIYSFRNNKLESLFKTLVGLEREFSPREIEKSLSFLINCLYQEQYSDFINPIFTQATGTEGIETQDQEVLQELLACKGNCGVISYKDYCCGYFAFKCVLENQNVIITEILIPNGQFQFGPDIAPLYGDCTKLDETPNWGKIQLQ